MHALPFAAIQVADRHIVYAVVAGYLLTLICVGLAFRLFSKNSSDYFRAGGQATWWLVGGSMFMGNFSAWTFTGAAGAAYQAGWSLVLMYGSGVVAYSLAAMAPAAWYRQTRMVTSADVIRMRFGAGMEQFFAIVQAVVQPLLGGVQLYALAIFTTSLLGFDIRAVIVVLGLVVLFYTALSGAWAVLAADFIKGLILLPISILVAVVCLTKFGGIGHFFSSISAAGLHDLYAPIKTAEESAALKDLPAGYFTLGFIAAYYCGQCVHLNGMMNSGKFLAVKDGREARRAAMFAAVALLVGMFVFFIPPMTARLLFPGEVAAMPLQHPMEGAYAAAALHFLPVGLVALVFVGMCSSTMSSLDATLTGLAGLITQNIYPKLCQACGWVPLEGRARLLLGQTVNLCCALAVIGYALFMARGSGGGVFKLMIDILALVTVPIAVPMLWGVFIRRVPNYAAPVSMLVGIAVSSAIAYGPKLLGAAPWLYHQQIFAVLASGTLAFFGVRALAPPPTPDAAAREEEFFSSRNRPVDFAAEIGAGNDGRQLRIIGLFAVVMGAAILSLTLADSSAGHVGKIICIGASTAGIGLVLLYFSRKHARGA